MPPCNLSGATQKSHDCQRHSPSPCSRRQRYLSEAGARRVPARRPVLLHPLNCRHIMGTRSQYAVYVSRHRCISSRCRKPQRTECGKSSAMLCSGPNTDSVLSSAGEFITWTGESGQDKRRPLSSAGPIDDFIPNDAEYLRTSREIAPMNALSLS
ncbi:hypothetical protein FB451DRAFT_1293445 [Mycena latifolia]|nr:hypothetical protein FB451DRAFT_1293445 [Mycena latifolia]